MKILVDARELHLHRAGIGRYIYNLFHDIEKTETEHEFGTLIMEEGIPALPELLKYNLLPIPRNAFRRVQKPVWDNIKIPRYMRKNGYEVFYAAGHFGPVITKKTRIVATIHDLTPFLFSHAFPFHVRSYLEYSIKKITEKSEVISVPSRSTKSDLINILGVPEDKIRVIQPSLVPTILKNDPSINPVKIEKYILSVGTNEPRKNLNGLIRAYALLDKSLQKDYPLVITGRAGWMSQDLDRLIEELGIKGEVIFTGFIEEPMLPYLFGHADVFCYPSFYEGFGFPPLEAMFYGAPVLTSNISSLPEVVGEAAILIDPHSIEDIASGLTKLLTSESLRWELRDEGRVRAQSFIGNDFASKTLELFDCLDL